MFYTVGYQYNYDKALEEGPIVKLGAYEGYAGGTIFRTREIAQEYLDRERLYTYAVYGVECDENDVAWTLEKQYGNLLFDRPIVRLEE